MHRKPFYIAILMAAVMACLTAAAQTHAQAVIRRRDVLDDWQATPSLSSPAAPALVATVPSWNQQPNSWRLGVAIENLETGVLLTDVERGMPADGAGLKRGDVIVAVGGYQVGHVDGALFDLGDELRRRVDAQGRANFLVFDARNRQLRAMPITLVQQGASGVRGHILCRERISLTSQAVLTVRLRDVTYTGWQSVVVGEHVIPDPPHPPIPFAIEVDPTTVYPDHRYAVDAWLVDRGQIVLQSSSPTPVTPLANNASLQITLVRSTASAPASNTYAVGQLEQINQWYRLYLLRDATSAELAAWQSYLQSGRTIQDVQAYILGSSEYYDRLGNQNGRYLAELYQNLMGRPATPTDLAQFQRQYQQFNGGRSQFVQEMLRRQPKLQ
jgi:uncharacterized lipoprotein YbaY